MTRATPESGTTTAVIRRAGVADVPAIGRLVNGAAELGLMLHRSLTTLYEGVRDFQVAVVDGEVVGASGLKVVWADLAELYALVVDPAQRGKRLGRRLAEASVEDARRMGVRRIMTLTYEQAFFERIGFGVVDRHELPLKVWRECLSCSKQHACDEIAMVRELPDVPRLAAPEPQAPPESAYVVPVTLENRKLRGRKGE